MIAIVYSIFWIAAAFKLADRNWKPYYPTLRYDFFKMRACTL